ncbi:MAG: NAD(P)-dependent alcohol dehydrogenase, partial [Vicinamibacterales bacterium]
RYGSPDVLTFQEVDKPVATADKVLVRVHASSVNRADLDYLGGKPAFARLFTGLRAPKVRRLGLDVAGVVEAVGPNVTRFQPGDAVFGDMTQHGYGAFAEYVCAPERAFAPKPAKMTFEESATVPQAAILALLGLRHKRQIEPGQKVLINGASGSVGPFAVQIAKALGAEVTGVCSTGKLEMARSLGADHVIDYTRENFTRGGRRYDLILDISAQHSIFAYRRALTPTGVYSCVGGATGPILQALALGPLISRFGSKKLGLPLNWKPFNQPDVAYLTELIEAGKLTPLIDRSFPLADVADALRYVDAGHARGKVVITF